MMIGLRTHYILLLSSLLLTVRGWAQEASYVADTGLPALGKSAVQWADFDNDGWIDVVMNGTDAFGTKVCAIYRNQRDNTFINLGAGLLPTDDGDLAVGDVNRDGWIDVLVSGRALSGQPTTQLYLNLGGGNFIPHTTVLPGLSLGKLAIVDMDNDGRADLLLSGLNKQAQTVAYLLRQQADGSFRLSNPEFTPFHSGDWIITDFNNDTFADVLLGGTSETNQPITQLWLNRRGHHFEQATVDLPLLFNPTLATAHLDDDKKYDLFLAGRLANGLDTAVVYQNTGRENFRYLDSVATVSSAASVFTDLDQDGDYDLLYTGAHRPGYFYRHQDDNDFTKVNNTVPTLFDGNITTADVNRDNATDYLLTGYRATNTPISQLFVNQNLVPNTPPTPPSVLQAASNEDSVQLSWEAGTDTQSSSSVLTYQLRIGTQPDTADILHPESFLRSGRRKIARPGYYVAQRAVIRDLPEGTYYWSVQAIDASGVASSFAPMQSFTICHMPDLGDNQVICQYETLELSAGATADEINWYSTVRGSLAANQRTLVTTIGQPDTIIVEAIKPTGCILYDTLIVGVLSLPQAFPPRDVYVCQGDSVTLTAGTEPDTVRWMAHPDSLLAAYQSSYTRPVITEDSILVSVTNSHGCQQQRWVYLHPLTRPAVDLPTDTTVCYGTLLEVVLDETYDSLHWYSATSGRLTTPSDTLRRIVTQPDTLWAAAYRATGCAQLDTMVVYPRALPLANAGPDTVVCLGGSVPLGTRPVDTTGLQFRWSPADDLDDPTSPRPIATPRLVGSDRPQTYVLTVTNAFGCSSRDTVTVYLDSASVVDAGEDRYVCYGSSIELGSETTAQGSRLPYRYQWTPNVGLDDPSSANPIASPQQTTTYQLVVFTAECPVDTAVVTIEVKSLPDIQIREDTVSGGYGEAIAIGAEGGTSYLWYPSQGVDNYRSASPRVRPEETTTYYVAGQDAFGCQSTDSVTVIVRNDLFIPNLFTPNGDGNNDTFRVYGYGIQELTFSIYNRMGKLLYRTRRPEEALEAGWNGMSQGYSQPPGVYTWSIQGKFYDGRPLLFQGQRSGTFKLIR